MIITRASNNYGPYQFPEKVIPLFITNALDDIPVPLYGDGLNERDWLHVGDHCRALDLLIDDGQSGEVYNIGGGNHVRNVDLTHQILELLGKPESLIRPVADRPGHDRRYCLDTAKVRSLGWEPQVPFEQGLADTVAWYRANEWWWRPIKQDDPAFRAYYRNQYGETPGLICRRAWSTARHRRNRICGRPPRRSPPRAPRARRGLGPFSADATIRSRRTVVSGGTASISSTPTLSHAPSNRCAVSDLPLRRHGRRPLGVAHADARAARQRPRHAQPARSGPRQRPRLSGPRRRIGARLPAVDRGHRRRSSARALDALRPQQARAGDDRSARAVVSGVLDAPVQPRGPAAVRLRT